MVYLPIFCVLKNFTSNFLLSHLDWVEMFKENWNKKKKYPKKKWGKEHWTLNTEHWTLNMRQNENNITIAWGLVPVCVPEHECIASRNKEWRTIFSGRVFICMVSISLCFSCRVILISVCLHSKGFGFRRVDCLSLCTVWRKYHLEIWKGWKRSESTWKTCQRKLDGKPI